MNIEEKKEEIQLYLRNEVRNLDNKYKFEDYEDFDFLALKTEGYSNCKFQIITRLNDEVYLNCIWENDDNSISGCLIDGFLFEEFVKIFPKISELRNIVKKVK